MGLFSGSPRKRRSSRRFVAVTPFSPSHARHNSSPLSPGTRRTIKWVVGAVVLYLFFAGPMGAWNLLELWHAEDTLVQQERELRAEIVELQIRRDKLESDTLYIERVARNEYNLAHPDEIIYEIE